jgi:hypothetical protein
MNAQQNPLSDEARYEPALPVDMIEPLEPFSKEDFATYIEGKFKVSEKIYEPLKYLLATYRIESVVV